MSNGEGYAPEAGVAFVDLHCHTSASFDSLAEPLKVVQAARDRGLTHLAITDHDRIDGALHARAAAIPGIVVIVGEEVKTTAGDLICLFLEEAIPPGLTPAETIARARAQGGLVGIPHPFDRYRGSMRDDPARRAAECSTTSRHNARHVEHGNRLAATIVPPPGVAVSDAHSTGGGRRLHGD
jgi:predicted metal-dependent phosphoesterase TrpH